MKLNVGSRTRTAVYSALSVVVVLATALLWQDYRHGWPFTRHHAVRTEPLAKGSSPSVESGSSAAVARTSISVDSERLGALGVRFERVKTEPIAQSVRAVATVVADETRISHVHTRVSGWLEQLYINTTGQSVRAGEPLAAVFSQELYASQSEYLSLRRQAQSGLGSGAMSAARTRLELLGMSSGEIAKIERTGQAHRLVTVVAPRNGVVLRRGVSVGTAIDPSTEIVTIADLSKVWVLAEISEGQSSGVGRGALATLTFPASGRDALSARVDFIYPTLTERTRTVRARFLVPNADGRLRPGLYGIAEFAARPREALTIARDAVVDTGESQHTFVRTAAGVLEPRTIKVGVRLGDRVEVAQGLSAGEEVVATGVFLIDSESRLRASGGAGGHQGHGTTPAVQHDAPRETKDSAPGPAPHSDHGR